MRNQGRRVTGGGPDSPRGKTRRKGRLYVLCIVVDGRWDMENCCCGTSERRMGDEARGQRREAEEQKHPTSRLQGPEETLHNDHRKARKCKQQNTTSHPLYSISAPLACLLVQIYATQATQTVSSTLPLVTTTNNLRSGRRYHLTHPVLSLSFLIVHTTTVKSATCTLRSRTSNKRIAQYLHACVSREAFDFSSMERYVNLHPLSVVNIRSRLDCCSLSYCRGYPPALFETACLIQACSMTLPSPLSATYWSTWSPVRPSATVIESVQRDQGEEWIGSWDAVGLYEASVHSSPSLRLLWTDYNVEMTSSQATRQYLYT